MSIKYLYHVAVYKKAESVVSNHIKTCKAHIKHTYYHSAFDNDRTTRKTNKPSSRTLSIHILKHTSFINILYQYELYMLNV